VRHLRGAKGTKVIIKIARSGDKEPRSFTLERDQIKVSSIKGTRMLDDKVGYIRITQFTDPTSKDLETALQKLRDQKMQAFILDLRNNPGGLLNAAIGVCEKFLKKGQVIVITKGRSALTNQGPIKALGTGQYLDIPMAILVNGGSASASEIVAGGLRDNRRAVLVGELTFGKASVQSILNLDEGALRLTTAHYYTPSERAIHDKGIEPDIVVPMTPEEMHKALLRRARAESPELYPEPAPEGVTNAVDRQLDRAIDLLHGILVFRTRQTDG
jgi:carboxyl-terminal processing protease